MFVNNHYCVNCDTKLTDNERMYSDGMCPHCGYKDKSACTIVEAYEKAEETITDDEFNKAMTPKKPIIKDLALLVMGLIAFYCLFIEP